MLWVLSRNMSPLRIKKNNMICMTLLPRTLNVMAISSYYTGPENEVHLIIKINRNMRNEYKRCVQK